MAAHVGGHPSESSRIVETSGEPFGFPEIREDSRELAEREERLTKLETNIDRALHLLSRVGQGVQRRQCRLETGHRFPVGRMRERFRTGLPQVGDRLRPRLALESM